MFKELVELDKSVVDRIVAKISEQDLPLETEIGIVRDGMVKILFIYDDPVVLNGVIAESISEEFDLFPL